MRLQIVTATISCHAPNLQRHVIGARGKQLTLRTPFDGIHLVSVTTERFNRLIHAQSAHMDSLICAARGKRLIRLPIHIQSRCTMERKLLCTLSRRGIPDNCGFVDARGEYIIAALVPLEGKNGTLVLTQCRGQTAICLPDSRIAIVTACGQQ